MEVFSMRSKAGEPFRSCRDMYLRLGFVVALAFALRLWFIQGGAVINPVRGDAIQYFSYAWNLVQSHIFSMVPPDSGSVIPDSYRDPGYPIFLASLMVLSGSGEFWYRDVLMTQAVLGALSAGFSLIVATRWLGQRVATFVGVAVALWPHSVAISGFLLSETLFGFMLLTAFWMLGKASESTISGWWASAGLCFGAASLVNATLAPFGPLLAIGLMARRAAPRPLLLVFLIGSLALPGVWSVRGLTLPAGASTGNRAMINLVQGSWAGYHSAYINALRGDEQAKKTLAAMDSDIRLAEQSPFDWLSVLYGRVKSDPLHYIGWYGWKPELLWAWNIRVGGSSNLPIGDVYPYPIAHPIYSNYPGMLLFESFCVAINPLLFVLMVATALFTLLRSSQGKTMIGLYAAALLVAYETLVYSILQSEPRYSIPFRPLEMMLAATAMLWLWRLWQRYRSGPAETKMVQSAQNN